MNNIKWYERGGIGDEIRDLLDYSNHEDAAIGMRELGLNEDEIRDVLLTESEDE